MIELIKELPDALWPALGASLLTLFGVWLQNIWESNRLEKRLSYDEAQRDRERQMQLRRDIYLEAADSAVKAQRVLSDIARVDKPVTEVTAIDPFDLAGLSKAHLVGGIETIKAFQGLGQTFIDAILRLIEYRAEYEEERLKSEELRERIAQLVAYRDHVVGLVRDVTNRIQLTATQAKEYADSLAKTQQQVEATLQERAEVLQTLQKLKRQLNLAGVQAGLDYGRAMAGATVAVRKELGETAGFDEETYERLLTTAQEGISKQWKEFVDRLYDRFGTE